MSKANTLLGC